MLIDGVTLSPSGLLHSATPKVATPKKTTRTYKPRKPTTRPRIKAPVKKNTYTKDDIEVYAAGVYYERRRQEFFGTNKKFFRAGVTKDHRSWAPLLYVVMQARECKVPATTFIEAQIWFFSKQWRTFPSPYHLTPMRGGEITPEAAVEHWLRIYGQCEQYYVPPRAAKQKVLPVDDQFYEDLLAKTAKKFKLAPKEVLTVFGTELFSEEFLKFKLA